MITVQHHLPSGHSYEVNMKALRYLMRWLSWEEASYLIGCLAPDRAVRLGMIIDQKIQQDNTFIRQRLAAEVEIY